MRLLAGVLLIAVFAGMLWAAPRRRVQSQTPASGGSSCQQEWQAMAQRHHQQADAMLKQISSLHSLLTMLRNDAGIVRDPTVRDALQVDADMWESLLANFQAQAASLSALAQQEESKAPALCGSK